MARSKVQLKVWVMPELRERFRRACLEHQPRLDQTATIEFLIERWLVERTAANRLPQSVAEVEPLQGFVEDEKLAEKPAQERGGLGRRHGRRKT